MRFPQMEGLRVTGHFVMLSSPPFPMSNNRSYSLVGGSYMPGPCCQHHSERLSDSLKFTHLKIN